MFKGLKEEAWPKYKMVSHEQVKLQKLCAKDMHIHFWTVDQGTVSKHVRILTWGTLKKFQLTSIFAAEVKREKQGTPTLRHGLRHMSHAPAKYADI